ncbi:MAG: BON domain-containing protein [Candidatus Contendobacter sp.]|nr:BON domain-containing protein [Candidatus Contendobacter sp.]
MNAWPIHLMAAILATTLLTGCVPLLVGGTAVGVGVAHDRRTAGTVVDDQTIALKLYNTLDQQLPPGNHINVTSYNGAVLLSGEVVSAQAREQAETIARRIEPPVREIYNELVIGPPSALSSRNNDTLLTTKVKAALLRINDIPDFDPSRVKVVTERGVVYLLGLVRPREADAAANVASQVDGVHQVVTLFEYIP